MLKLLLWCLLLVLCWPLALVAYAIAQQSDVVAAWITQSREGGIQPDYAGAGDRARNGCSNSGVRAFAGGAWDVNSVVLLTKWVLRSNRL